MLKSVTQFLHVVTYIDFYLSLRLTIKLSLAKFNFIFYLTMTIRTLFPMLSFQYMDLHAHGYWKKHTTVFAPVHIEVTMTFVSLQSPQLLRLFQCNHFCRVVIQKEIFGSWWKNLG